MTDRLSSVRGRARLLAAAAALLVPASAVALATPAQAADDPVTDTASISQTVGAAAAVPGAPLAVTATGADHGITVSWTPPADDGGDPINGYVVTPSPDGRPVYASPGITSADFLELVYGRTYTFTVAAINGVGTGPVGPVSAPVATTGPVSGVAARYAAAGGAQGALGAPLGDEVCYRWKLGCQQDFQGGSIYWSRATGAKIVKGGIQERYRELYSEEGRLGYPVTDVVDLGGGAGAHFEAGSIYSTPAAGAHAVWGEVRDRWAALGWQNGVLGYPITDEVSLAFEGSVTHFQNGSMYSSPETGLHVVWGALRDKWASLGWQTGFLGFPTTDATNLGNGWGAHFQGGSVYWSPSTNVHVMWGALRDKWAQYGWQTGVLGYPTSDATDLGNGWGAHFQGGSVYWSPSTGAHVVKGLIRDKWASLGWQTGQLGYPTSDEAVLAFGAVSHFQYGSVYWSTMGAGVHAVRGAIRDRYAALGWEHSKLGYPTSDEYDVPGGRRSDFERGYIEWTPAGGAVEHLNPQPPMPHR